MDSGSGGGSDPGTTGRLESFKAPRDLTLSRGGQLIRSRRSYASKPNIPPKRDRSGAGSTTIQGDSRSGPSTSSARGRGRQGGPGGRGGSRERKPKVLVQSESIFSEGVGEVVVRPRKSTSSSGGGGGGGSGGSGGGKGSRVGYGKSDLEKLVKRQDAEAAFQKTDPDSEDQEPIGGYGDFISDLDKDLDIDRSLQPISLPLSRYLPKPAPPITLAKPEEVEVKVKIEPLDGTSPATKRFVPLVERPMPKFEASSFPHALLTAPPEGTLVFFQMPNKLPVLAQTPASDSALIKETKLATDISVLPEGYIGKIQILASGKTRFILGDNAFDIEPGAPVAFRQELAAIDLERNKMTNLGPIKFKFNCVPDLDSMLRSTSI